MTLGQEKVGAFDGYFTSRSIEGKGNLNLSRQTRDFLNYTQVEALFGKTYNLSPRFHMCGADVTGTNGQFNACIMAFDFKREQEIDLGQNFPFSRLERGECLLSTKQKELYNFQEGQTVSMTFLEPDLWATLAKYYNKEADAQNWPRVPALTTSQTSTFSCTVVGFYEKSYGKFS